MPQQLTIFPLAFPSGTSRQQHWNRIERLRVRHNSMHPESKITWQEAREIVESGQAQAEARVDAYLESLAAETAKN